MSELTPTTEDYLKVIWGSQEWSDKPVTTGTLAKLLGVTASTVSEGVKRLTLRGLLDHPPYGSIELTSEGRLEAIRMVRKHRLLESFLSTLLGYQWDEVHDEAEILEHAVSDTFIQRLDPVLGCPQRDPHGDPIPNAAGELPTIPAIRLADVMAGEAVQVARVSDQEPDILRFLSNAGIGLDTELVVVDRREAAGMMTIRNDEREIEIGVPVAEAMWVIDSKNRIKFPVFMAGDK